MVERNLTNKFIKLRSESNKLSPIILNQDTVYDALDLELLKNENSSNYHDFKENVQPGWLSEIQQIDKNIKTIQEKISEFKILNSKRLKVTFNNDEKKQEREIDFITNEITSIFKQSENILNKFANKWKDKNISQTERKICNNIQIAMAKKLQNLSLSFQASQKEYLKKLQEQKNICGDDSFKFLNEQKSMNDDLKKIDSGFGVVEMQILQNTESIIDEREQEIIKIAKSIEELAVIFKELHVFVIDQGTILDRIDYNMDHAIENMQEGRKQLQVAEKHQKSAMSFRCIIVMCVLIALLILILVFKHTSFKKN